MTKRYDAIGIGAGRKGLRVIPLTASMTFKQDGFFFGRYYDPDDRRRELMRHSLRDADAAVRFFSGSIAEPRQPLAWSQESPTQLCPLASET